MIKDISPVPLSIAAIIVTTQKAQFILATIYMNVGEEFSTNNIAIFQQMVMLKNILNLPIRCIGDYDIHNEHMLNSGLLQAHSLKLLPLPEIKALSLAAESSHT